MSSDSRAKQIWIWIHSMLPTKLYEVHQVVISWFNYHKLIKIDKKKMKLKFNLNNLEWINSVVRYCSVYLYLLFTLLSLRRRSTSNMTKAGLCWCQRKVQSFKLNNVSSHYSWLRADSIEEPCLLPTHPRDDQLNRTEFINNNTTMWDVNHTKSQPTKFSTKFFYHNPDLERAFHQRFPIDDIQC